MIYLNVLNKIIISCNTIFFITVGIIGLFVLFLFVLMIIDKFSNKKWFCEKMGWHKQPIQTGFDGCSQTGVCPRCGKHVLQDGQGNWF